MATAKKITSLTTGVIVVFVFSFFILPLVSAVGTGNSQNPPPVIKADLSNVTFTSDIAADVKSWPASITLSVTLGTDSINYRYDKMDKFSPYLPNDGSVGNGWLFVYRNGWQATTVGNFRANHGNDNKDAADSMLCGGISGSNTFGDFTPVLGEKYGFMVSGQARAGATPVLQSEQQRSNVVMVDWTIPLSPITCDDGSGNTPSPTRTPPTGPVIPPITSEGSSEVSAVPGWAGNLAYNSTANNWLVVSQNNKNITGQLMSDDGEKIGGEIKVATGGMNLAPRVGYAPDLNKFFVVWIKEITPDNLLILGQFINPDGTISGNQIQIDQGKFLFHANSSVEYDSKNKKFVIVWENRANGVQVYLNTVSSSGQPGTGINITTSGSNGSFNGAPSVAVNEQDNQYCVMYQHVTNPATNTPSEVTVIPVSASNLQLGQSSILSKDAFFVYNIAYNSTDNNYMGIWSAYRGAELRGKIFSDCKDDPEENYLSISETYHNGNLAYNSKSNSYGIIVQEAASNNNHIYTIDNNGESISDIAIFTGGRNGNFAPRISANTTTGMYAAISSEDYVTTKFASNLGGAELLSRKSSTSGAFPSNAPLPVPSRGLPTDLGQIIGAIFVWSLSLIGLVLFVRFFYAGFLWFTAAGNASNVSQAKDIMWNAVYGTLILFSAWLILNTINPDLVGGTSNLPGLPGTVETSREGIPPPGAPPPAPTSCNQKFNDATPSSGCATTSSCVDVSNYTTTRGCESNGGVCLLSQQAANKARTLITSFNTLSAGKGCSLKISSAIQVRGGPSVSKCHKPNNAKSGTCLDFNIVGNHATCSPYFYQAAKDTKTVVSFLDEYVPACKPASATGGNIHVNF